MLRKIIPTVFFEHIRLLRMKKKFRNSIIETFKIGNNVELGKGSALMRGVDIRDNVKIGENSYVNPETIIASGIIGKYCSIGYRCQIGMFEHPVNHMSTSPYIYNKNRSILNIDTWEEISNPPIIGNDVWIGSNVIIMQGVKIGNGSIIGAGAVVTKDVAPYSVVGGVPAKLIKKRFDEKYIKFLENIKWWDLDINELNEYKYLFEEKDNWINKVNE